MAVARAVMGGASPNTLANVAHALGPDYKKSPDWKFRSAGHRMFLAQRMYNLAKKLLPTEPTNARLLARGALAVIAMESTLALFPPELTLLRPPEFATVAQLTDREYARLRLAVLNRLGEIRDNSLAKSSTRPATTKPSPKPLLIIRGDEPL